MSRSGVVIAVLIILLVLVSYSFYSYYVTVQGQVSRLLSENRKLKSDVDAWKSYASSIESQYNQLMKYRDQLEKRIRSLSDELSKLNETYYYRSFRLLDYRNPLVKKESVLHLWYPGSAYIAHRLYREHIKMVVKHDSSTGRYFVDDNVREYMREVVRESIPIFQNVARDILVNLAGNDKEFYTNLVLQIVHQLKYEKTKYSKYPIETLIEGVGDCDCLALLLATFLESAGIDTVLIITKLDNGFHVVVGVNLPNQPDDLTKYGRTKIEYINYNNKKYYIAEATWDVTKNDPLDPQYLGFFVGDPVKIGTILTVINV